LQPDNIVVSGTFEYLVEETLSQCKPAWVKDRVELTSSSSNVASGMNNDENWAAKIEDNELFANKWEIQVQVAHTFLCFVVVPCQVSAVSV